MEMSKLRFGENKMEIISRDEVFQPVRLFRDRIPEAVKHRAFTKAEIPTAEVTDLMIFDDLRETIRETVE